MSSTVFRRLASQCTTAEILQLPCTATPRRYVSGGVSGADVRRVTITGAVTISDAARQSRRPSPPGRSLGGASAASGEEEEARFHT